MKNFKILMFLSIFSQCIFFGCGSPTTNPSPAPNTARTTTLTANNCITTFKFYSLWRPDLPVYPVAVMLPGKPPLTNNPDGTISLLCTDINDTLLIFSNGSFHTLTCKIKSPWNLKYLNIYLDSIGNPMDPNVINVISGYAQYYHGGAIMASVVSAINGQTGATQAFTINDPSGNFNFNLDDSPATTLIFGDQYNRVNISLTGIKDTARIDVILDNTITPHIDRSVRDSTRADSVRNENGPL